MDALVERDGSAAVRAAVERLRSARDCAHALHTVPTRPHRPGGRALGTAEPAVDLLLWALHVRYARRGDREALHDLVEHYRPYAEAVARRFYRNGEPVEDLTQVAYEALMAALGRFEPEQRRPFLAFARPTITGVIRRYFRDLGWSIRTPRWMHELSGPVRDARDMLTHDLGRDATDAEVADFVGITEHELRQVVSAEDARRPGSLDRINPVTEMPAEQLVGEPDPGYEQAERRASLQQAIVVLPSRDRELLARYYLDEQTQAEIASDLDCSQMQVSRLLGSAVRRLQQRVA